MHCSSGKGASSCIVVIFLSLKKVKIERLPMQCRHIGPVWIGWVGRGRSGLERVRRDVRGCLD